MEHIKQSELFWDSIHKNYERSEIKTDNWLEPFEDIIARCSGPILDLGCGSGNDTMYFVEKGKKVYVCDQSQHAISNIEKNFPEVVECKCFNMIDGLDYQNDFFEIICADLSLHYFTEKDTANILKEIRRVLIPDGHLLMRVNSVNDTNFGAGVGEQIEPNLYRTEDGMYKRFFDEADIRRIFSDFDIMFCEEQKMLRYREEKCVFTVILKARKLTWRTLTEEDKKQICQWKYEGEYEVYNFPSYEEMSERGMGFMNPDKEKNFLGFFERDRLVGFLNVLEEEKEVFIGIGVEPSLCGKHYGRRMLEAAYIISKQRDSRKPLYLEVRTWNARAIKCYQNAGFSIDGEPYEITTPMGKGMFYRMICACKEKK